MSSERDWTALLPELIHLVSQKLPDLRYFIRCRAVCKKWFSSVLLSDPPQQQLPWLIVYDKAFPHAASLKEELRFYSFVDGETGSMPIHESHRGKVFHKPGHNYLLVVDSGLIISLLNPLTNKEISLPQPPIRFDTIWPVFVGADLSHNWQWHIGLVFYMGHWRYMTYYPDKMRWQYVDNVSFKTCYRDGMLFATDAYQYTMVFDAASRKKLYTIPPPNVESFLYMMSFSMTYVLCCYLVESCGEILRVNGVYDYDDGNIKSPLFHIHKLNFEGGNGQPHWVKVRNIRDQIIFLDFQNGFSVKATAGLKGNCIYFILENYSLQSRFDNSSRVWRYDISTGTCERVPVPFGRCTWFVPILR